MRKILIVMLLACIAAYAGEDATNPASAPAYKGEDTSGPPPLPAAPITTTAPNTASARATVYFYRSRKFVAQALAPDVYCDESPVARIANGRYLIARVPAGKHLLRSTDKQSGIEMDVQPDTEYFIRVDMVSGAWTAHGRTTLTSPEQGRNDLAKFKANDREDVNAACIVDPTGKKVPNPTVKKFGR